MLIKQNIERDRIALTLDDESLAARLKSSLVGSVKGGFLTTLPYNERVDIVQNGSNIILNKSGNKVFSYEEIKQIIRKVRAFTPMEKGYMAKLLSYARAVLDANFTFFYPTRLEPQIEITFMQNNTSITIEAPHYKKMSDDLKKAIARNMTDMKVASGHNNTLTIHSYNTHGLFVPLGVFRDVAKILVENEVLDFANYADFSLKAMAFCLKRVAYLEAHQLCTAADQVFEVGDFGNNNSLEGTGMKPILGVLSILAKEGKFSDLSMEQIDLLNKFMENPESIDRYPGTNDVKNTIRALITTYPAEIYYYANASNLISNPDPSLLQDASANIERETTETPITA